MSFIEKGERFSGALMDLMMPMKLPVASCQRRPAPLPATGNWQLLHNHLLLTAATGDDDFARVLQPPNDIDDLLLGGLNIAHAHRAHVLHVLGNKLRGAL